MLFDSHIHTNHSSDSSMRIEEVIEVIREKDIGVILTEHLDLNYPDDNMFKLDIEKYFKEYEKYRSNKLLLGIEIGLEEGETALDYKKIVSSHCFDYVLGSTHIVEGIDLYEDEFYINKDTLEVKEIDMVYDKYFNTMLRQINENPYFDSLGHIDYIARYAAKHYNNSEIYYDKYSYIIDKILKEVALMEKALEINTRRLNSKKSIENLIPIYRAFKNFGGKLVTIGSDSHSKDSIGANFKNALNIIHETGLTPVYYKERKVIKY
ncbi:MAG: histidinol-phosphatase HisJ family protein [Clostridium sp.]